MDASIRCRPIMIGVLVIVLSFSLVACNGGEPEDVTAPEPPPAQNGAPPVDNGEQEDQTAAPDDPPAQPDEAALVLVETRCSGCHPLDRVWSADYDRDGWDDAVARMEARGLQLTPEERATIIDYLAGN